MRFKEFLLIESREDELEKMRVVLQKFADGRRKGQVDSAIDTLKQSLRDKKIYNAQLDDAKSTMNYAFDKVRDYFDYPDFDRTTYQTNRSKDPNEWQNILYLSHPTYPHQLSKFLKIAEKHPDSNDTTTFFGRYVANIKVFIPYKEIIDEIKGYVVKGRIPDPNATPKKVFTSSIESQKLIRDKFIEVTKDWRAKHEKELETYIDSVHNQVEKYMKDNSITNSLSYDNIQKMLVKLYPSKYSSNKFAIAHDFFKTQGSYFKYELLDSKSKEYETIKKRMIERTIDSIHIPYVEKNTDKLAPVVERKADLKEIKIIKVYVSPYALESNMLFTFDSGAEFIVVNKSVYGYSATGKSFVRFPTTFHDVKLSDGTKMSMPSEEKMNTDFK